MLLDPAVKQSPALAQINVKGMHIVLCILLLALGEVPDRLHLCAVAVNHEPAVLSESPLVLDAKGLHPIDRRGLGDAANIFLLGRHDEAQAV